MPEILPLDPPRRTLMGPGPSGAHPSVLAAMGAPILGHLDPEFIRIMDECQRMMRRVLRTENEVTLATPGTGTSGMEAQRHESLGAGGSRGRGHLWLLR